MTTNQYEKKIEEYWTEQTTEYDTQMPSPLVIWENTKLKMDLILTEHTEVSTEHADKMTAIEKNHERG